MPARPSAPRVVLIGRRLPHNENLGLGYLRAALDEAQIESTTCYVNDAAELARAVATILASAPDVVGLSLPDGGSALLPLALGEALHRAGYRGHVTCGGPFATLARDWLLARHPWLDSVVRFAGEGPLVELVSRVARGEPAFGVPGVTTREGDGPSAPVLDPAPIALRPRRDELPRILGHAAAHVLSTRGCRGRCAYCGPAALQTLERREGERAGVTRAVLTQAGVGGVRRRALEAVCDELAELWHARDVRYFYFVDEHLLPYDDPEALAFLAALKAGLRARDVGPFGFGAMLRADRLTPAIVRALADAGMVRAFVGLELAGDDEAKRFGRPAPTARELAHVQAFADVGVATVSNLMLLHPDSTPRTIEGGLALLARIEAGVFEATRMMVYHGTRLCERMAAEGRLQGNPLRYGYSFRDATMARFSEIFTRLRAESFHDYSVAYRTHDAHLALALAKRLDPARVRADTEARLAALQAEVRALYLDGYRKALALAAEGGGFREASSLASALRARADRSTRALERVEREVLALSPPEQRAFAPMRSAAAGIFTFTLAAATPACGGKTTPIEGGDAIADVGDAGTDVADSGDAGACDGAPSDATAAEVQSVLQSGAACFSGSVQVGPGGVVPNFSVYGYAGTMMMDACNLPAATLAAENQAAVEALARACITSAEPAIDAYVQTGASGQAQSMAQAIQAACASQISPSTQFSVALDATGAVLKVTATPAAPALTDCVTKALAGLKFPCLAGFEVCAEFVIAE